MQLVDQVVEFEKNKSIVALKAVGIGEPSLKGHFPGFPIMPGVLLVEALGQACALLLELTRREWKQGDPVFVEDDVPELGVLGGIKVKLMKPVLPGTLVRLKAELDWTMGPASSLNVKAYDENNVFTRGSIVVAMAKKDALIPSAKSKEKEVKHV